MARGFSGYIVGGNPKGANVSPGPYRSHRRELGEVFETKSLANGMFSWRAPCDAFRAPCLVIPRIYGALIATR